eukprot:15278411-Alexandrium_andersonii.AAC.1
MSASLVGSEMCIRDRRQGGRPRGRALRLGEGSASSQSRLRDLERSLSVSYTHLTLPTICSV